MKKLLVAALLASSAFVSVDAQAAFINGAFGASNNFGGIANATLAPTTSLLPGTLIFNAGLGSGNNSLSSLANAATTVSSFSQGTVGLTGFTVTAGGFTWTVTAIDLVPAATADIVPTDCNVS